MMSDDLFDKISEKYPGREVKIEVSEDGENGALIEYDADYKKDLTNDIQSLIRVIPDHPKPGIMYQDMASLFNAPNGISKCMTLIKQWMYETEIAYNYTRIIGLDARGFV